ncbi:uncharacterized protein LOC135936489 [Cloeon dipterum]|uniref:uncharacterized protein LOC135936489 n=1 Tax=Cloeon dipterum TaxID=197152 RepID=UPI0032202FC3
MRSLALAVVYFIGAICLTTAWRKPAPMTGRMVGGGDDFYRILLQGLRNPDDPFQKPIKDEEKEQWVCNKGYDLVDRGDDICCYKFDSYEGRCCTKVDARNCFHVAHVSQHIN